MIVSKLFQDALCQLFSHIETRFIDGYAIHDGIGSCKVDVFKDAWMMCGIGVHHFGVAVPLHIDKDGFSRLDVPVCVCVCMKRVDNG
jgi:hypothetical protein